MVRQPVRAALHDAVDAPHGRRRDLLRGVGSLALPPRLVGLDVAVQRRDQDDLADLRGEVASGRELVGLGRCDHACSLL